VIFHEEVKHQDELTHEVTIWKLIYTLKSVSFLPLHTKKGFGQLVVASLTQVMGATRATAGSLRVFLSCHMELNVSYPVIQIEPHQNQLEVLKLSNGCL
jgi:hypothetical protein